MCPFSSDGDSAGPSQVASVPAAVKHAPITGWGGWGGGLLTASVSTDLRASGAVWRFVPGGSEDAAEPHLQRRHRVSQT